MKELMAALFSILLLAPSVLGAPSVAYQGDLVLACRGATSHSPAAEAEWADQRCPERRSFDAVGPMGVYEATFSWEAGPGYETLQVCLTGYRILAEVDAIGGQLSHGFRQSCAVGASPLVVSLPATAETREITVEATVAHPGEPVRLWLWDGPSQPVSFVVTHDPDT